MIKGRRKSGKLGVVLDLTSRRVDGEGAGVTFEHGLHVLGRRRAVCRLLFDRRHTLDRRHLHIHRLQLDDGQTQRRRRLVCGARACRLSSARLAARPAENNILTGRCSAGGSPGLLLEKAAHHGAAAAAAAAATLLLLLPGSSALDGGGRRLGRDRGRVERCF